MCQPILPMPARSAAGLISRCSMLSCQRGLARAIRKNPVRRSPVRTPTPLFPKNTGEARIHGQGQPRCFCLCLADVAVDNASSHQQRQILPTEITPFEPYDLAGPETETGRRKNHRAVGFGQLLQHQTNLAYAHSRYRPTSATLPDNINGINVRYLPPTSC